MPISIDRSQSLRVYQLVDRGSGEAPPLKKHKSEACLAVFQNTTGLDLVTPTRARSEPIARKFEQFPEPMDLSEDECDNSMFIDQEAKEQTAEKDLNPPYKKAKIYHYDPIDPFDDVCEDDEDVFLLSRELMTSLDFTELEQEDDNEVSPMDVEVKSEQHEDNHVRSLASLKNAFRNITNQFLNINIQG